jgi:ERCC4-type nuclease
MTTKLLIDYREKAIIDLFQAESYKSLNKEVVPLEVGDFHYIVNEQLYLVIERKTECDLNASIKDGRWREQKERLDILKASGTRVVFLIERVEPHKRTNIDFKIIRGALVNTIFRDEYPILYSDSFENTVEYLELLYKKISSGEFDKTRGSHIETCSSSLKKKMSRDDFLRLTLCSIPRVSINISNKICETYKSLEDLIDAFREKGEGHLADIQVTEKKKIGKKLSSDIYEYLFNKKCE